MTAAGYGQAPDGSPDPGEVPALKVMVRTWGQLRFRLGWDERDLELPEGATVGDALRSVPGVPPGAPWTGNDGGTLYDVVTRDDAIRVDKWLCVNGRIRTDRTDVVGLPVNDGDQILVMEATALGGG